MKLFIIHQIDLKTYENTLFKKPYEIVRLETAE